MNTLIVSLLLATIFTNNSMCMDDPIPTPTKAFSFAKNTDQLQLAHTEKTFCSDETTEVSRSLPSDILKEFILNTHKYVGIKAKDGIDTPEDLIKQARNFFVTISSLNKEMYKYTHDINVVRTVVGNVSNNYHQDRVTRLFATYGINRYNTSRRLYNANVFDIPQIEELIQGGADVNYFPQEADLKPILMRAAEASSQITEFLLKAGANPNIICSKNGKYFTPLYSKDGIYFTPLSCAITAKNYDAMVLLIKHKDVILGAGKNAAIKTIKKSKDEYILALFHSACVGTDVNATALDGSTALSRAIKAEDIRRIELLLEYNPTNKCLPLAVETKNLQIIHTILAQKNIPLSDLDAGLDVAAKMKDSILIEILILAGADPIGSLRRNREAFNLLHTYVNLPAILNKSELTIELNIAVKRKDSTLIEVLILAGADPIACLVINPDALDLLHTYVNLSAILDKKDATQSERNIGLSIAVKRQNSELIERFVETGADLMAYLERNRGAFDLLYTYVNLSAILDKLAKKKVTQSELIIGLSIAAAMKDSKSIEILISAGADPMACLEYNCNTDAFDLLCQYIE